MSKINLDDFYDDVVSITLDFGDDEGTKSMLDHIDKLAKGKFASRGEYIRHALRQQLDKLENKTEEENKTED